MLELNKIYNCDCRDGLEQLDNNSVDLTVTSCPYDNLRSYHDDEFAWNFDIFKEIANELYRVTKPGGVVVWVVGDAVVNGGETGTSFKQALYFQEIGFKIHDTMIYEKNSSTFPAKATSKRYSQIFEYMFVFSKGKIREDIKLIADKPNKWAGWTNWGTKTQYDQTGNLVSNKKNIKPTPEFSLRTNIWKYNVSFNDKTGHPAVFPEKLAEDHILSWSNEGDVVLDPFMGSGTTAKMALLNRRNYIGFEKNTEYYEVSLKRVAKYEGKTKEEVQIVDAVVTEDGDIDKTYFIPEDDKELAGKVKLFEEFGKQLEEYFGTMSLSILKTLRLTFQSKANDRRVEEVLKERGISGYTKEVVVENEQKIEHKEEYTTPSVEATEKKPEYNELNEAFKTYYDDKDAFIRDCVRIEPKKCEFKAKIGENNTQPKEENKVPENGLKTEIINILNDIFGGTDDIIELIKWFKSEKEKIVEPNTDYPKVDYCTNDSSNYDNTLIALNQLEENEIVQPEKKKRGRPKGSKNKPKTILDNPENFKEGQI